MEIDFEEKLGDNGRGVRITEPSQIFYCRGINNVHGHGLDPMLFSTVKLMIREVKQAEVIKKAKIGNQSNEILPC